MLIEQRRLVRLGRSTLVVSLPADWVKKKGLKAGDMLTLVINDAFIKIVPSGTPSGSKVVATIEVKERVEGLYRAIIATYIAGADIIKITFEDGQLLFQIMKQVKMAMNNLIGLEIVEQNPNEMVLQVFISGAEQSPKELTKRLIGLLTLMINQVIRGGGEVEYLEELENEVDKLYRLALRTLNTSPEVNVFMVNLLSFLEMTSDSLIPLAQTLDKNNVKEVLDILNIIKETLEFLQKCDEAKKTLGEIDEKIAIVEMGEEELERRRLDEKLKYRILLFLHNLKNALLTLHNMEVNEIVKKTKEKKLIL